MSFSAGKCKAMHVGEDDPNFVYLMNGYEVKQVNDLGVIISSTFKVSN